MCQTPQKIPDIMSRISFILNDNEDIFTIQTFQCLKDIVLTWDIVNQNLYVYKSFYNDKQIYIIRSNI